MTVTINGSSGLTANNGSVFTDSTGNTGVGTGTPDVFSRGYGRILGLSSASSAAIEVSAATGNNAVIDLGVNGTRSLSITTDGSTPYINSIGALPIGFATNGSERARIDSTGNFSITQAPGKYTVDVTGGQTSIANNGTVDFPNSSGMLLVTNQTNGFTSLYICSAGSTPSLANVGGGQAGSMSYVSGIAGYRWTNNSGSTATVAFFFVRTRTSA